MEESYPNRKKTLWEKEKLLVMSNFSFSHSVFKKACFPEVSKGVIVWEWVKMLGRPYSLFPWLQYTKEKGRMQTDSQILAHPFTMKVYKLCPKFLHGTPRFSKQRTPGGTQSPH